MLGDLLHHPERGGGIRQRYQLLVCQLRAACMAGHRSPLTARVIRAATVNLLRVFAAGPAGRRHPSHSNLARFHITPSGL